MDVKEPLRLLHTCTRHRRLREHISLAQVDGAKKGSSKMASGYPTWSPCMHRFVLKSLISSFSLCAHKLCSILDQYSAS